MDVLDAALIEVDLRVVEAALISEFEVFFVIEAARTGLSVEVFDGLAIIVCDGFDVFLMSELSDVFVCEVFFGITDELTGDKLLSWLTN